MLVAAASAAWAPRGADAQAAPARSLTDDRWTLTPEVGVTRGWFSHQGNPVNGRSRAGRTAVRTAGLSAGYRVSPALRLVARGAFFDVRNSLQAYTPTPSVSLDPAVYTREQYGEQAVTFGGGFLVDVPVGRRVLVSAGLESGAAWTRNRLEGREGPSTNPQYFSGDALAWDRPGVYLAPSAGVAVPVTHAVAVTAVARYVRGRFDAGPGVGLGMIFRR